MKATDQSWFRDPLSVIGLFQGVIIWSAMAFFISLEIAWISLACGGIIGIFLSLIALGYQRLDVARFTLYGIILNAVLSSYSAWVAFI
tara:strand:+ start:109 stop:372 length:264 start_codon:yes stop_codon:yes gene_type:complete